MQLLSSSISSNRHLLVSALLCLLRLDNSSSHYIEFLEVIRGTLERFVPSLLGDLNYPGSSISKVGIYSRFNYGT